MGIRVPAVFSYFSTRMMLAAGTSLMMTIWLGPAFIRKLYEWKIGQPIRTKEECPVLAELHGKKKDTPTMGGVLILSSMVGSLILFMDLKSPFTWLLLITTVMLGILGGMDDYLKLRYKNTKGASARKKLLVQLGVSAMVGGYLLFPSVQELFPFAPLSGRLGNEALDLSDCAARFFVPFKKDPLIVFEGGWRSVAFLMILLVITGASNAVNLTDGLDGLAAGCLVLTATTLSLFAFLSNHTEFARYLNILYIEGSGEIAVYLLALAGAALGFLWYNGYPAQVFMGDTGSLALGGVLGVAAVLLRREVLLAIVGGVFVAEALSVILQVMSYRYRNKKRIFLCAPLHHHYEYLGWPETKVVLRFWIVSLLFCIVGIGSLKFQ
jgi:phospho-N-acetylmuramoyl-pentapeptide-transferase